MGTLSQGLGAAGPGTTVNINGKTWTLTRSTKSIQAAWGAWLADRAELSAMSMASKMRKEARRLYKESRRIQEMSEGEGVSLEQEAEFRDQYEDMVAEARSLEIEASKQVERFTDRKASGEYEFHGNVGINLAQQNLAGQFMLAYLCLKPKHPDVTMEDVIESHKDHIYEWRDALLKSEGVAAGKNESESEASTEATTTTTEPA